MYVCMQGVGQDSPAAFTATLLTYLLTYSVALVRKRTIRTEQLPLVGEVSTRSVDPYENILIIVDTI
jgi:hypothetical protein